MISTFRLSTLLIIIQLRLNTDEYPIISMMFFLFICIKAPSIKDRNKNGYSIDFCWNVKRYTGAIFCHVIKIVLLLWFISFSILMNHWWKGEAAIFTVRASTIVLIIILFVHLGIFHMIENSKRAEDTD